MLLSRANINDKNSVVQNNTIVFNFDRDLSVRAIVPLSINIPNLFENVNQYYRTIRYSTDGLTFNDLLLDTNNYDID